MSDHPNRDRLDAMFRSDPYAGLIGAELVAWDGGYAHVRWTPGADHTNFTGTPHGGAVFSACDVAFSIAGNSWGRVCVAHAVDIHYLAPPGTGRPLDVVATERQRRRRSASHLVEVRDGRGELLASFHAMLFRTDRWHFGERAWPDAWRDAY